ETAFDPVRLGLVSSLNQPGGNVTGVTSLTMVVAPKRLELLHELIPTARVVALLVNPTDPAPAAETNTRELQAAAHSLGLELHVLNASRAGLRCGLRETDPIAGRRARDRLPCVFHRPERTACRTDSPPRRADGLPKPQVRRGRRPGELWRQHYRLLSPSRRL